MTFLYAFILYQSDEFSGFWIIIKLFLLSIFKRAIKFDNKKNSV